jgi:hypothetical protein
LAKTGAEGAGPSIYVIEIDKPDDLGDVAHLGLSLAESKLLLAGSSGRSSPLRPEPTSFGGWIVDAAVVFTKSRTTGITR